MGEKNDILYEYLGNPAIFADFINVSLFAGEKQVNPESVKDYNEVYNTRLYDRRGRTKHLKRERDRLKKVYDDCQYVVLGEENQDKLHPFMPFRCMEYDVVEYGRQTKNLKVKNKKDGSLSGEEYLAGIKMSDRLMPVITIVFYHGKKPYDSCKTLHDMLDFSGNNAKYKPFAADYKMNLVTLDTLDESLFETGLRELIGVMKRSDNKEKLREYCNENRERLENLDEDTYDAISVMINQKNLIELKKTNQKDGGMVNMCKAIEDMVEEGRIEGKAEGRIEGKAEGRIEGRLEGKIEEKLEGIRRQREKGYAVEDIADNVDMEVVLANQIIEVIEKKPQISNEEIISRFELVEN